MRGPAELEELVRGGRSGIGLCLSGGGFRAALFHLGALRRLHELGILKSVRWISSVSGGSILAGHIATCQRAYGLGGRLVFKNWQRDVAKSFRAFVGRDLRTWPVMKNSLWNWLNPGPLLSDLERRYRDRLTTLSLKDLPEAPEYVFCATDLTFGVNWRYSRRSVGSYQAGYIYSEGESSGHNETPLARAIAASACFPPLFGPMAVGMPPSAFRGGQYTGPKRDELLQHLVLSDGGVYDNMALEPVWRLAATVLVSDCGAPFEYEAGKEPWRTLLRYTSVVSRQTQSLRIRMLQAEWRKQSTVRAYNGTRWHLAAGKSDDSKSLPNAVGYSEQIAEDCIAKIRTDLDAFSDAEMCILENHGYCNADYQIRSKLPKLVVRKGSKPVCPYPEWMDEGKVRAALSDSSRRFVTLRLLKGLFQ